MKELTKTYIDQLDYKIVGCAIEVYKELGPGILESLYHKCLTEEFLLQAVNIEVEKKVEIIYKGKKLTGNLRCDFYIEDCLALEIKSSRFISELDEAQSHRIHASS